MVYCNDKCPNILFPPWICAVEMHGSRNYRAVRGRHARAEITASVSRARSAPVRTARRSSAGRTVPPARTSRGIGTIITSLRALLLRARGKRNSLCPIEPLEGSSFIYSGNRFYRFEATQRGNNDTKIAARHYAERSVISISVVLRIAIGFRQRCAETRKNRIKIHFACERRALPAEREA